MLVYHTEEPRFILFEIVFDNSGVLVLGLKASHLHEESKKKIYSSGVCLRWEYLSEFSNTCK